MKNKILSYILAFTLFTGLFGFASETRAANVVLSLSPTTGTFVVDSTFDVSVYLNTQGQSVNTIELNLKYPQDKLQLVSSSTGKSIIGIWTSLPKYDNATGKISLVGGIPGGITVGQGLITTFTFRVRAVGSAIVKFETSRVLLNDGLGTEVLSQTSNSVYNLVLPPPGGPVVVSNTHPDQTKWYDNNNADLSWGLEGGASGYSYVLNDQPIDTPDDISEGAKQNVSYKNLSDGRHYFHIKSFREGQWGGITHYAINVDTTPPAEFKIEIIPGRRTTRTQPVIQFATTDSASGVTHYELKIVPLSSPGSPNDNQLFVEAQSPFVPEPLSLGNYDVIVRAYDNAGNIREVVERLSITTAVLRFIGSQGLEFKSALVIPWLWIALILLVLLILAGYIAYRSHRWHQHIHERHLEPELPGQIAQQLEELQKYRSKYGKMAVILLMLGLSLGLSGKALAETAAEKPLSPPVITTISRNISNEEIFYVGGRTGISNSNVLIYLQNEQTVETLSELLSADKNGEWFYRGESFLTPGTYLIWAQTKLGQQLSPPSPQISITVESTAVQFGSTKFSYTTIYFALFIFSLVLIIVLSGFGYYNFTRGRKKHKLMMDQISEAEASVRRGFAVLNRDLEAELATIRKAKMTKELSAEEKQRELQLSNDLKEIEQHLSREIWQIEDTEVRA